MMERKKKGREGKEEKGGKKTAPKNFQVAG